MSTYLKNVQDKVTAVRPPQTDWQFEAQLLSTRQSRYDAGHKKLTDMYGQILNAGLTRDENIQSREEFFKLIDNDLRKVAGIDLSLESSVSQAQNVYSQIYENDYLVKDMVWTKNFQAEMQRADGFKNCVDAEKCGGQYWDEGVKYMNHKRQEFRTASNDESMRTQDAEFIPYNNLMAQAIKDMETAGLDITTMPHPDGTGKWKVTTRNGNQLVEPLTQLFNGLYQKNPQFRKQYEVLAYNGRKDWTQNAVQSGQFATPEEAALGYVEARANDIQKEFDRTYHGVKYDTDALTAKLRAYEDDSRNGKLTTAGAEDYDATAQLLSDATNLKSHMDMVKSAQKNMNKQSAMNSIGSYLDQADSFNLLNDEIKFSAMTLANKNKEVTYDANEYAINQQQHGFDVQMELMRRESARIADDRKFIYGGYDSDTSGQAAKKLEMYNIKQNVATNYSPSGQLFKFMQDFKGYEMIVDDDRLTEDMSDAEVEKWIKDLYGRGPNDQNVAKRAELEFNKYKDKRAENYIQANIAALDADRKDVHGYDIPINWNYMDKKAIKYIATDHVGIFQQLPESLQASYGFEENGVMGEVYQGDSSKDMYVKDGFGTWHILDRKGSMNVRSDWKTSEKINRDAKVYHEKGRLNTIEY
jgi:hypothetical protein